MFTEREEVVFGDGGSLGAHLVHKHDNDEAVVRPPRQGRSTPNQIKGELFPISTESPRGSSLRIYR